VYEFEPLAARALEAQSRQLLAIAGVASLGILGLAFALARGLSQRERLLEELERGKRLAALGSMSAVLAHELRNPLASLKGHAQLLAESVEEDTRLSPKAGRVVSEAVRLEHLLNDLLTFVKSGELHKAPTDPNEVLRAAVQAAGDAEIDVSLLEGNTKWSLDPARMQQTLENILRNARQASPAGTRIGARVEAGKGQLTFTVRDRGPGIAPGEEERIFEPFVTGRIQGVGLGLAITRRIVELHGGTVTARTHPEGGAEFRITLPGEES
ncbi:MAG: HAMP domain-containing sensor histidine kinase, partial [Myxococcaceae bacterium]